METNLLFLPVRFPELESPRLSKVLRTTAFAYPFLFDNLPLFYRVKYLGSPQTLLCQSVSLSSLHSRHRTLVPSTQRLSFLSPAAAVLGQDPQLWAGSIELQPCLPPPLRSAHRLPFRSPSARAPGTWALRLYW